MSISEACIASVTSQTISVRNPLSGFSSKSKSPSEVNGAKVLLTATGILLEEFYQQGLEFLDGEAGNYIRQFFTSYYVGVFALLLTILALIFMLCEISIKKLLNYYLPVYLKQVNAECYQESMKPIYVKLG